MDWTIRFIDKDGTEKYIQDIFRNSSGRISSYLDTYNKDYSKWMTYEEASAIIDSLMEIDIMSEFFLEKI